MGMKYTITESTVRKAVREAVKKSPKNDWVINENFLSMFFNALAGALDNLKNKFEEDSKIATGAIMAERHKGFLTAARLALSKEGLQSQYGGGDPVLGYEGFQTFDWQNEQASNVIVELLQRRLNEKVPAAVALIGKVAALPAIPGLSEDGQSSAEDSKSVKDQTQTIEQKAKEQASIISQASEAVTMPFADIGTICEGDEKLYGDMTQLLNSGDGSFGVTAVDFLHKVRHIDTVVGNNRYGANVDPRIVEPIKNACIKLKQAADAGLTKYANQGNYQTSIAWAAKPSDLIQKKASAASAKSSGDEKGESQATE